jgi:histidinol-phosphate/aromatic aminotransferase/cobyric acid decarboxylase-like protein
MVSNDVLDRIMADARGLVFLDEAYAEFSGVSHAAEAAVSDNVLVVRTMSKAFGLAGLRVGYAIGPAELVAEVEKSRGPFKVNALAELAATAALTSDVSWMREHTTRVVINRELFSEALRALGLSPLPSSANFVLVPVPDAKAVARRTRDRGVLVRDFAALPLVGDALRIGVGPWDMMAAALEALESALR